jgi:TetR/AcrR family transcriptional regulator, transcriptional repressor for nem operon
MRYSVQQKQETRERIVRAASKHFRGRGWDGVAIADLMGNLNLTHGGFYRHFDSKEQLFAEAVAKGFEEVTAKIKDAVEKAPPGGELKVIIEQYLSLEHYANPDQGCPVAALASEIARYPRAVRVKIDRAMRDHLKRMSGFLPGATEKERQRNCLVLLSGMSGALTLARTVADNEMRQSILQAAREFYIKAFCP